MTPEERLIRTIFGDDSSSIFIDYPYIVDGALSALLGVMATLEPKERRVIELRFGFENGQPKTLRLVGREFLLTHETIRTIKTRALRKLRHPSRYRPIVQFMYKPTVEDRRAVVMRERLYIEILRFYPEKVARQIAVEMKRPYLKRALRDLSTGNVAQMVRYSCGLTPRYCKTCGLITLPNWDFCSRECKLNYRHVTVICDYCGNPFQRRDITIIKRLGKQGLQHQFCSRSCFGKHRHSAAKASNHCQESLCR